MIKQLTITVAATAALAIAAPTAAAAVPKPVGPGAQAPAPAQAEAVDPSADTPAPEASEPTGEEAAVSAVALSDGPDATGAPAYEANAQDDEDQPGSEQECADLEQAIGKSLVIADVFDGLAGLLGDTPAGQDAAGQRDGWLEDAQALNDTAWDDGCYDGGPSAE